jgi:hypothetical protein
MATRFDDHGSRTGTAVGLGILRCGAASDENGPDVLCMADAPDGDSELIFVSEKF